MNAEQPPSAPIGVHPCPSVVNSESAEVERLRKLIADARKELQYASASNCPLHWVKVALEILAQAEQKP